MPDKFSMETLTEAARRSLDRFVRQLRLRYADRLKQAILYAHKDRGEGGADLDILVVITGLEDRFAEMARIHEISGPIKVEENVLITALPVDAAYLESQREAPFFAAALSKGLVI
ncbi:MAG TPA: hypothetical protein VI702_05060 [Nitrospiria bacterium]